MAHPYDSIVTYVRKFVRGILGQPSSLISNVGNPEVYTDIDQRTAICDGFRGNTAVYSITMKDAKKFGSIPRYVYDASTLEEKAARKKTTVLDNDLSKLLNRPNDTEGQDAFFTKVRASYKITGEAFIWLNRGDVEQRYDAGTDSLVDRSDEEYAKMPVLEMYALPSDQMIVYPDDTLFGVDGYALDMAGTKIPFRKVDIIHWKSTSLSFDAFSKPQLRGMPALTPGYKSLQQNNDATNASVRMYQNDGAKGVLANETFDDLSPVQKSKIEGVVERKINNSDRKGAVATLQGKWIYLDFGQSSVDMQLLEGKDYSWKEICFLLGMPYEFFDSHTPYAEKQLAQQSWVTNEIIPDCKQLDGEMNRVLLVAFDLEGKAFIGSDYWDLPEMQAVRKSAAEGLMKLWPVTPNQVLEAIGYEARPEPEFDEPWIPTGVTPLSQIGGDEAAMQAIQDQLNQVRNDSGGN